MSQQLLKAVEKGDAKKVVALLDGGADLEWRHKGTGRTALGEAAIHGGLEIARLLVERGADVNARDKAMGFAPLAWAIECKHLPLVELLLEKGADVNLAAPASGLTPLMVAAGGGDVAVVERLLAAGADQRATAADGRTALSIARATDHAAIARVLAEQGAPAARPAPAPAGIAWPAVDETGATCDHASPETVLRGFIFAMNQWERRAAELTRKRSAGAALDPAISTSMKAIFDRFCTPAERPYGRNGSYREPPEYDPDAEALLGLRLVDPRRAELTTRNEAEAYESLYVATRTKARWLLDSKRRRSLGGRWSKWHL